MQILWDEDKARVGAPPQDGTLIIIPRKNALPICRQQNSRREVPIYSYDTKGRNILKGKFEVLVLVQPGYITQIQHRYVSPLRGHPPQPCPRPVTYQTGLHLQSNLLFFPG